MLGDKIRIRLKAYDARVLDQSTGEIVSGAITAGLRQRATAGRNHNRTCRKRLRISRQRESVIGPLNSSHAMPRFDRDAEARGLVQQGVEYRTRAIAIGEQLAVIFLVQPDTKLLEERCSPIGRKRAQHVPDDTW